MGNIAADLQRALAQRARDGARGGTLARPLAAGSGWSVADVLCTHGPRDASFEEQHDRVCIAMVVAGAFAYRTDTGHALLTPGALMLGNAGACFECGHRHGAGDRCFAFHYAPTYFERLAADAGIAGAGLDFRQARIAPLKQAAPLIARACAEAMTTSHADQAAPAVWSELAVELAAATLQAAGALTRPPRDPGAAAWSRVVEAVHLIDASPEAPHTLASLACAAALSEFHFLRTFQRVTGVTPHQYVLRTRLRAAALRLRENTEKIVDIALACGFNDLSNFNHAFRQEFDVSPREWRTRSGNAPRARGRARQV